MIKHILKIIWTERKVNAWILIELIFVFIILWFCADYLSFMLNRYLSPRGFDIEHTYMVNIGIKDEARDAIITSENDTTSTLGEGYLTDLWSVIDRIKRYPAIENVAMSRSALPYTGNHRSTQFFIDTAKSWAWTKSVTPEFFDVFKTKIVSGKPYSWDDIVSGEYVVAGLDKNDEFVGNPKEQVKSLVYKRDEDNTLKKITGFAQKVKRSEYEEYASIVYEPVKKDDKSYLIWRELCVRVKPDADINFREKFVEDMQNQLEVGPYYLTDVVPIKNSRDTYMKWTGYDNNFKSIYAVSTFLIINIFLGIIGTFWFRVQSRRSEIGLRIALGASKNNIKKTFVSETLLFLILASVIATIVCVNVTAADLLNEIGIPTPHRGDNPTPISQYLVNYVITFVVLALISIVAVWYPAKQASDIQPTEALRDE